MDRPGKDMTDSQRNLAAIVDEIDDKVTGAIEAAEERGKRRGRTESHRTGYTPIPVSESNERMRAMAEKVFDDKIRGHRLNCMEPGGGLCEIGKKVDKILEVMSESRGEKRVMSILRATGTAVALAVLGFVLNHFAARRSEDTWKRQEDFASAVSKNLQKVEEATKALSQPDLTSSTKASR
jgi:hypothetical protein